MIFGAIELLIVLGVFGVIALLVFRPHGSAVVYHAPPRRRRRFAGWGWLVLVIVLIVPLAHYVRQSRELAYLPLSVPTLSDDSAEVADWSDSLLTNVVRDSTHSVSDGLVGGGSEWLPDVELTHAADVYDSYEAAGKRLGVAAIGKLAAESNLQETVHVRILCGDSAHSPVTVNTDVRSQIMTAVPVGMRAAAQQLLANANQIQIVEGASAIDTQEEAAVLSIVITTPPSSATSSSAVLVESILQATLTTSHGTVELSPVRVSDKPWVQAWNAFRNRNAQANYWQFRGATMEKTEQTAADYVAAQIESAVRRRVPRRVLLSGLGTPIDLLVRGELERNSIIVDRFSQTFQLQLSDGTVAPAYSRSAVLADLSPARVDTVTEHVVRELNNRARHQANNWRAVGMLGMLICLVYAGLNAATKGYYTGVLRGGAVVLLILLVLLLVA